MKKEMKINEVLGFGFKKIKCVQNVERTCSGCVAYAYTGLIPCSLVQDVCGDCWAASRRDKTDVRFEFVEE